MQEIQNRCFNWKRGGGWEGGILGSPARFTREEREIRAGRRLPVLLRDTLAPHPHLVYTIVPDWAEADFPRED